MKFIITENKRYQLAYKILDRELDGLTRKDVNLNTDSVLSNWRVSFIDKDGDVVMVWSEKSGTLYVTSDIKTKLSILSLSDIEVIRLIYKWFTDRVRLEPDTVIFSSSDSLNWDDMGLSGISDYF